MKKHNRERKQRIALGVCISILAGMIFTPLQNVSVSGAAGSTVANEKIMFSNTVLGTGKKPVIVPDKGLVTGRAATPGATAAVTPTPKPVITPNPNATLLLGNQTNSQVRLTVGEKGTFDLDWNNTNIFYANALSQLTSLVYESSNSQILSVTEAGSYAALGVGKATLTVTGYGVYGYLFERNYYITVCPDMRGVTLEKTSVTLYQVDGSYSESSVKIKINSNYILNSQNEEEDEEIMLSSSNQNMYVEYSISQNVLTLSCSTTGTTKLTLVIYGKEFTINLKVVLLKLSATSLLLSPKQTKQLKVKGISGKVTWKSSNKKMVNVNSKGKVRAKKLGNVIITAKIEDCKLGCVVSVTTAKKKKVIARAKKIAKSSKYSQAKRMQNGYYDCSSLVWRAYSPYGCKFGSSSYAPTAAGQAQWLAGRKKLLKGGYSRKNVQNLKIRAGDLLFETSTVDNGRYKGIYHVEMFAGYVFCGFDSKGKAIVASKWANRPDGYYYYGCGIVGQP